VTATASSLLGYLTVFAICGVGALVAALLLFLVPKLAFADVDELEDAPLAPPLDDAPIGDRVEN
jgi:hypothetical protein